MKLLPSLTLSETGVEIKMPPNEYNKDWLKMVVPGARVRWGGGGWVVSVSHFNKYFYALREMFGVVYVVTHHNSAQGCNPSCESATRALCECACKGMNHAGGGQDWYAGEEVDEYKEPGGRGTWVRRRSVLRKPATLAEAAREALRSDRQ